MSEAKEESPRDGVSEGCASCGEPASKRCSGCKLTSYCDAKHQQQDWPSHKLACKLIGQFEKEFQSVHARLLGPRDAAHDFADVDEQYFRKLVTTCTGDAVNAPICVKYIAGRGTARFSACFFCFP